MILSNGYYSRRFGSFSYLQNILINKIINDTFDRGKLDGSDIITHNL